MKREGLSVALFSLFYLASGILMILEAILSTFTSFHLGILGASSIVLAFMAMKKRRETTTLLLVMFIPMVVFGAVTLYVSLLDYLIGGYRATLLAIVLAAVYLTAVAASLVYAIRDRKIFTK